ncbi:MAG: mandelate racemase/muconate lactonizing enzyme family protein [Betaproteobacteria bacterium]|nr:mandelate racemase/muconate lactonizing enzyme family protein [Betaproteobacteria bacterium]
MSTRFRVRSLRPLVFRYPVETPVRTSFGVMHDRPMLLVRAEDGDGVAGWGEAWCNFPTVGAEHRARLVASVLAPLVEGAEFATPADAFRLLTARTEVLAIQSGERGPIAQAIAGVDIALWDLAARKRKQPLWRLLGGASPRVPVYASGLNPDQPEKLAARRHDEGYRAFKLKIGFGPERDLANLKALRATLGRDVDLMVDANQAWSLDAAVEMAPRLEAFGLKWLEEPLRADRPWSEWQTLVRSTNIALAAGENVAGEEQFDAALASRVLRVVQPDMAKWGGFSGCLPVAKKILAAGLRYCPHYLGGGIGLLASAHLLAAAGGDGMLEVDANDNPLRTELYGPLARLREGACALSEEPGLGAIPDPREWPGLRDFLKQHD